MSERTKNILIDCLVGLTICAAVVTLRWSDEFSVLHQLCDGFFVAGVMLAGVGGLKFCGNKGAFDMMAYSLSYVFYLVFPGANAKRPQEQQNEKYYDYVQRKQENRKPTGCIVLVGLAFLAVSLLLLVAYEITQP